MSKADKPNSQKNEVLSQAIQQFGDKWDACHDGKKVMTEICRSERNLFLNSKVLRIYQSLCLALLSLIAAPIIVGLVCIFVKYDFILALDGLLDYEECLITQPKLIPDILTTPPANCNSLCQGLVEIPSLETISQDNFLAKYAYSGRPLLIHKATNGWKANDTFGFSFFKRIFQSHAEKLANVKSKSLNPTKKSTGEKFSPKDVKLLEICEFYSYNRQFDNLANFLNVSETWLLELGSYRQSSICVYIKCLVVILY